MIVPFAALRHIITIENFAGEGAVRPVFDEPREVWASVQDIQRLVVSEMGDEMTADTLIIIRPEAGPVPAGSRITIGDGKFRVVKTIPIPDNRRPSHWEVTARTWGVIEDGSSS